MSEIWLSGPIDGVTPVLMPAAHTFLQVQQDVASLLSDLAVDLIWQRVGRSASIGFHALHIAGATDRLLTYARGEQLTAAQIEAMKSEATAANLEARELIARVSSATDAALTQIRATPSDAVLHPRQVGRKLLPSTTLGLIVHAAEHALRHAGQMATLRKIVAAA